MLKLTASGCAPLIAISRWTILVKFGNKAPLFFRSWSTWAWDKGGDRHGFEIGWGAWTDWSWHQGIWGQWLERAASSNWTRNCEDVCLLWGNSEGAVGQVFVSPDLSAHCLVHSPNMFRPLQGIIFRGIISGEQPQKIVPERLFLFFEPGVRKYWEPGGPSIVYGGVKYLLVLVLCHFSGT
jgi:hypothetical protein